MAVDIAIIAQRYATALFELTHDQNSDTETLEELKQLKQVALENPDLAKAIAADNIAETSKKELLRVLTRDATQLVKNLIHMLYDYRRFDLMIKIIDAYEALVNQSIGHMNADVKTAVALSDEQVTRLEQVIAKRFNANSVALQQTVDAALIGGVVVQANNQIVDGSLATKLAAIRQSIVH
ncbi:F0F1 ATP synthase subunit delta [Weissella diestrammenae]|uniref:ATP synthase subunit delta n=1 Tax=Weissella diestrammenae TaxID=1162633 RepID=A0A7G9T6V3_9LACO|nr:ATP synthase F1 subunit delta [Weissella diestrammenae]MCM0582580.1 F0F1 ATP synthase subunit delta [Weissella diestrammenae]QNN75828.1 F0F1 ATP synthase subunit delta [Weissella diestrammenae]